MLRFREFLAEAGFDWTEYMNKRLASNKQRGRGGKSPGVVKARRQGKGEFDPEHHARVMNKQAEIEKAWKNDKTDYTGLAF